jgi:hypothetical protein
MLYVQSVLNLYHTWYIVCSMLVVGATDSRRIHVKSIIASSLISFCHRIRARMIDEFLTHIFSWEITLELTTLGLTTDGSLPWSTLGSYLIGL